MQPDVIIVGAGIAGLAAGAALLQAHRSVMILEAGARIGGRIHTSRRWQSVPVDLGASWIHGVDGNPVSALAHAAGAAIAVTRLARITLHIDASLSVMGVTGDDEAAAQTLFDRAMRAARRRATDISVHDALEAFAPHGALSAVQRVQLGSFVNSRYEQEYGASAQLLSAWALDDYDDMLGEDALFPGGYDQILRGPAAGLDIRLNQRVTRVTQTRHGVTITLADGATLSAIRVIVTVPLGVLKAGDIAFDPPLPADKQRAIDGLGMGLLNKHVLRFDRIFWPPDDDWHICIPQATGQWCEWISMARAASQPVLIAFTAAGHAEAVEAMSDADQVAQAMEAARIMFGTAIPEPVAHQCTRWRSDPLTRGAYSFDAVGSSVTDRKALASDEGGGLLFAGEATSQLYPGTVHGALFSGQHAAHRLIAEQKRRGA